MTLPVEDWNAQISLMTGMAAAKMMLDGDVGILRTMPPPDEERLDRFRRQVAALGLPWPSGRALRRLPPQPGPGQPQAPGGDPRGGESVPGRRVHAVRRRTAREHRAGRGCRTVRAHHRAPAPPRRPLRARHLRSAQHRCARCRSGCATALPELPHDMASSDGKANQLEKFSLDAIEAALLSSRVGEEFDAVVIQTKTHGGVIQLTDPVVTADMEGSARPGDRVLAELVQADIADAQDPVPTRLRPSTQPSTCRGRRAARGASGSSRKRRGSRGYHHCTRGDHAGVTRPGRARVRRRSAPRPAAGPRSRRAPSGMSGRIHHEARTG